MSDRPTEDEMLLAVAQVIARRGTCSRARTGAVIARRGRVLSTGYNGAPAGMPHCVHQSWDVAAGADPPRWVSDFLLKIHEGGGNVELSVGQVVHTDGRGVVILGRNGPPPRCSISVHAETNAVAFAARHGIALEDSTMYALFSPCNACAQLVINAGIRRVVTTPMEGPRGSSGGTGERLLRDAGVDLQVLEEVSS